MSRKLQIVLPDPLARELEALAAAPANPSPRWPAGSQTVSEPRPRAARSERPGSRQQSGAGRVIDRAGLSPTVAAASGGGRCGERSWLCTVATRATSKTSKPAGGRTSHRPRRSARWPHGEPKSTMRDTTPAKSSPSNTSLPTTLTPSANKAVALRRPGGPEHRRRSGANDVLNVRMVDLRPSGSLHTWIRHSHGRHSP